MIGNDWDNVLDSEFKKEYFYKLLKFVQLEYSKHEVYPPKKEVFRCFRYTPYKNVKVVILGQQRVCVSPFQMALKDHLL